MQMNELIQNPNCMVILSMDVKNHVHYACLYSFFGKQIMPINIIILYTLSQLCIIIYYAGIASMQQHVQQPYAALQMHSSTKL